MFGGMNPCLSLERTEETGDSIGIRASDQGGADRKDWWNDEYRNRDR
jgi:hypothetical protein